MNVADACFALVHDYPGGAEALGPRLGKLGTSLSAEVRIAPPGGSCSADPKRTPAKLGVLDAVRVSQMANDLRILNAFAAELGCMVVRLPQMDSAETPAAADVARVAQGFSDLMCGVASTLADRRVTDVELADVEREVGVLVATTQRLLSSLGRMNAELHAAAPDAVL